MDQVRIGSSLLGDGCPVHIAAEIGGNFTNFKQARRLIDLAIEAGVDSVKLQTFKAETIASRSAVYDMPNTGVANQFELFKKYEVDLELHRRIWDYCREQDIFVFSTPSHIDDVALLEEVGCQAYKIGSDDAWNIPFLTEVADRGRPIVLSSGMCTMDELRESVSAILGRGNSDLVLLHCVTNYPAQPEDANLRCVETMKSEFGVPVGYSDHTLGNECCLAAVALGANMLEKHFTHDKNAEGPDHMLSADPTEMKRLVADVRSLERALGDGVKRPAAGESTTRINNRKSIIALVDIAMGSEIKRDMIAIKRPGFGVPPKYFDEIIGHVARAHIRAEDPVTWDAVSLPRSDERR